MAGPAPESMRLPSLLLVLAENLLLHRLASRHAGSRAATWAVIFNLISSFSFVRARSLLDFGIVPFQILLLAVLVPRGASSWAALLWGVAAPIVLTDYEASLFVIPAFLAYAWTQMKGSRGSLAAAALGAVGGTLLWTWKLRDTLGSYLCVRFQGKAGNLWSSVDLGAWLPNLLAAKTHVPFMGVSGSPALPYWLCLPLALGIVLALRRRELLWLPFWLALGLLPAALSSGRDEPNRLVAAWPALCVLSGLGYSSLPAWRGRGPLYWTLALLLPLLAGLHEVSAYAVSMREEGPRFYGEAEAARQLLQSSPPGSRLFCELGPGQPGAWRQLRDSIRPGPSGRAGAVALVSWAYVPALRPEDGTLRMALAGPERPPLYLLACSPAAEKRMEWIEGELKALRGRFPDSADARRLGHELAWLESHQDTDPLLFSAALQDALDAAAMNCLLPARLEEMARLEKVQGGSAAQKLAEYYEAQNPELAARYARLALKKDPRRGDAAELLKRLQGRSLGAAR
jgi:hypothetical protein